MNCGVGHRLGSDLSWLWLWHRPTATTPIQPLEWEPPYAAGAALEKTKRQTKTRQKQKHNKKIDKTKTRFFAKINRIDKPLGRNIKKKRERTQTNEVTNEIGKITTNTTEIQKNHKRIL